jgi:glycerophosphoryl diester phosphodiesterase
MKILGHRGAAGSVPENTLEGFAAAFDIGVDAVELDIVPAMDGTLLVRHEGVLELTTNIAEVSNLADRCTMWEDGSFSWLVENFNGDELRALHARERYPEFRAVSASQDDLYMVPTLLDVFNDRRFEGKSFIVELKHAKRYKALGLDMVKLIEPYLLESAFPNGVDVALESFDWETCLRLIDLYPELTVIFPIDVPHWSVRREGLTEAVAVSNFLSDMRGAGLAHIAASFELLFEKRENEVLYRPTLLLEQLRSEEITVYGFTASDDLHRPGGIAVNDYWRMVADSGLDGVFTDQPEKLKAARLP